MCDLFIAKVSILLMKDERGEVRNEK